MFSKICIAFCPHNGSYCDCAEKKRVRKTFSTILNVGSCNVQLSPIIMKWSNFLFQIYHIMTHEAFKMSSGVRECLEYTLHCGFNIQTYNLKIYKSNFLFYLQRKSLDPKKKLMVAMEPSRMVAMEPSLMVEMEISLTVVMEPSLIMEPSLTEGTIWEKESPGDHQSARVPEICVTTFQMTRMQLVLALRTITWMHDSFLSANK